MLPSDQDMRSVSPKATADFAFTDLSGPTGLSREDARRFQREQVAAVIRNTPFMMVANIMAALWLVWASWDSTVATGIAIWAAAMSLMSGLLLYRTMRPNSAARRPARQQGEPTVAADRGRTVRRAEMFAIVLGLLWASLPALFMSSSSPELHVLIMGVVMGASGMGAFSLSRIPSAAMIYSSILSGALALASARNGDSAGIAAFGLASIYGIGLAAMIVSAHRNAVARAEDNVRMDRQNEIIKLLLRDFQAGASDWLWETDAGGRLVYVSDRLAEVAGRSAERLIGARLHQAAGMPADNRQWCQALKGMQRTEPLAEVELPVRNGGRRVWWQISARPLFDELGSFKGYRGVGRDITARRQAEIDLIRAKEAAERADAAKSQFLAVVSHELRTPLNAIGGFADLLTGHFRDCDRGNPAREFAENIHASAAHLSNLINDILDVTRMERGEVQLVEQELDPQELTEIVVKICRTQADPKDIALVETYPRQTYEVSGDLTRMKQILINLISNAVKFTPAGGRVDVAYSITEAGGLEFIVSDTGIGIEDSKLAQIFEPFVQADQSHARRFGGVGLGLSIARRLARLHGGEIAIESVPGVGTTARFILPPGRVREFKQRGPGNRGEAA